MSSYITFAKLNNLNNRSVVLQDLGRLGEALECLDEKEGLSRRLGDKVALATCLGNRASILLRRGSEGDLSQAESLLLEKERLCSEVGLLHELASCLGNQAHVARLTGHPEAARALLVRAGAISRQLGDPRGEAISLFNEASLLWHELGEGDSARRLRDAAIALAEKHGLRTLAQRFRASASSMKSE